MLRGKAVRKIYSVSLNQPDDSLMSGVKKIDNYLFGRPVAEDYQKAFYIPG